MSKAASAFHLSFPALNSYTTGKLQKDEEMNFSDLAKALELASNTENDEKQLKNLNTTILPRLCFFSGLPLPVLHSLFKLSRSLGNDIRKEHKKVLRLIYYFLHVTLGPGQAGTPQKTETDDNSSATNLPPAIFTEIWNSLMTTPKDLAQHLVTLRIAGSLLRFPKKEIQKNCAAFSDLLKNMLSLKYKIPYKVEKRNFLKGLTASKGSSASENKDRVQLQICTTSIIRNCLPRKERKKLIPDTLAFLKSEHCDSRCVRHILGLAVEVAETNPQLYTDTLTPLLEKNMQLYIPSTGLIFMDGEVLVSKAISGSHGEMAALNLNDVFSRKYLARGSALIVLSLGKKGRSSLFWKLLVALACDDPSLLVAFEAIKCMAGYKNEKSIDVFSKALLRMEFKIDQSLEEKEVASRPIAWQNITREDSSKKENIKGIAILNGVNNTKVPLLKALVERLCSAIAIGNFAEISGACRTACELAKCRAYAVSSTSGFKIKKSRTHLQNLDSLINDLVHIATSTTYFSTSIKYLALLSLIWFQSADGGPLSPAVFSQILRTGDSWTRQMFSYILQALFHRLIVEPKMATYILDCVNGVVAGHPSKVNPVELVDFWSQSFNIIDKTLVLNAALQFLEAPVPPRALSSYPGNTAALGASTESFSAWRKLKRIVTWWLGEAANFITDEFVWDPRPQLQNPSLSSSLADTFSTETISNPLLMSTVSHLCHCMINATWEIRLAAVKSLSSIAFRSAEPFRIQIYSNFKQVIMGFEKSSDGDALGLAHAIEPILTLLDQMYSGQAIVNDCISKWGGTLEFWPEVAVESINERHNYLLENVSKYCSVPAEFYFPLGPKSRALLCGEEIPVLSTEDSIAICRPQPQYSDFIDNSGLGISHDLDEEECAEALSDTESQPNNAVYHSQEVDENYSNSESPTKGFDYGYQHENSGMTFNNSGFISGNLETSAQPPDSNFSFNINSPFTAVHPPNYNENSVIQSNEVSEYQKSNINSIQASNNVLDSYNIHTAMMENEPETYHSNGAEREEQEEQEQEEEEEEEEEDNIYDMKQKESYEEETNWQKESEELDDINNPFNQEEPVSNIPMPIPQQQIQGGFPKRATVLFDFDAEMEGELTVHIGDVIMVTAEEEGGWYYAKLQTVTGMTEGLVPSDYVEIDD